MKERGILFCGEMALAAHEDRNTQTRRVVLPQPVFEFERGLWWFKWGAATSLNNMPAFPGHATSYACPYGVPGDRLWVREACWMWGRWVENGKTKTGRKRWRFEMMIVGDFTFGHRVFKKPIAPQTIAKRDGKTGWVYRHARYMPRWACRSVLEVVKVRAERLQEIDNLGALEEGTPDLRTMENGWDLRECFRELWDRINQARGFGWEVNPWVWVVEFKRVNGGVE